MNLHISLVDLSTQYNKLPHMACEVLRVLMGTSGSSEKMEAILETVLSNHYFPPIVKHMAAHSKKWLPWCPLMLMYLAQGLGSSLVAFSYKEQLHSW